MSGLWDLAAAVAASAVDAYAVAARAPRRPKRKKSWETAEFGAMVERQVRALARRVRAEGDVESLALLSDLTRVIDEELAAAVGVLRAEQGYSWADVARVLGETRQAAQQRWGKRTGDV